MKDSEFFSLLNLYLDHEISAADAARLEAEVQGSPERRKVYQQYCRMQKACTMLAKDFTETAPAADEAAAKVVAFEPRRSAWGPGFYAVGGLVAAAACIAVVLIKRNAVELPVQNPGGEVAVHIPSVPQAAKSAIVITQDKSIARTVTMPAAFRTELQPAVSARNLMLTNNASNVALSSVTPSNMTQLNWLVDLKIAPMKQAPMEKFTSGMQITEPKKAGVQAPDESISDYLVAFGYGKSN